MEDLDKDNEVWKRFDPAHLGKVITDPIAPNGSGITGNITDWNRWQVYEGYVNAVPPLELALDIWHGIFGRRWWEHKHWLDDYKEDTLTKETEPCKVETWTETFEKWKWDTEDEEHKHYIGYAEAKRLVDIHNIYIDWKDTDYWYRGGYWWDGGSHSSL